MNRQEALDVALDYAGPLGPFFEGDLAERMHEHGRLRRERAAAMPDEDASAFIGLVLDPPDLSGYGRMVQEDWEYELYEWLLAWMDVNGAALRAAVSAALEDPAAWPPILAMAAELQRAECLRSAWSGYAPWWAGPAT